MVYDRAGNMAQSMAMRGEFGQLGTAVSLITPQLGKFSDTIIDLAGAFGPFKLAINTAADIVQKGFSAIEKSATELVGAIAQIGGAKGLQAMLVESIDVEKLINRTRFAVTADERSSSKDLRDLARGLSERSELGGFQAIEWLQAINKIGVLTNQQASIQKSTLEMFGKMALISGESPEKFASTYATLKSQNLGLTDEQIKNVMLTGFKIGQQTSFELAQMPQGLKLMRQSFRIGGMPKDQADILAMALGGLILPEAGNLMRAGTQAQSFLVQTQKANRAGDQRFQFDPAGNITNLRDVIKLVMNTDPRNLPKFLMERESGNFIKGVRSAVSQRAGIEETAVSPKDIAAREKVIDDLTSTAMGLEELTRMAEESMTPQAKLQSAFNRISNHVEEALLPVLEKMVPVVDNFANIIMAHKDDIGNYFSDLAAWLGVAVEVLPTFLDVMSFVGKTITAIIIGINNFAVEYIPGFKGVAIPTSKESAQTILDEKQKTFDYVQGEQAKASAELSKRLVHTDEFSQSQIKDAQKNLANWDKAAVAAKKAVEAAAGNEEMWENMEKISPEAARRRAAEIKRQDAVYASSAATVRRIDEAQKRPDPNTQAIVNAVNNLGTDYMDALVIHTKPLLDPSPLQVPTRESY